MLSPSIALRINSAKHPSLTLRVNSVIFPERFFVAFGSSE
jgi:hypothetical protein